MRFHKKLMYMGLLIPILATLFHFWLEDPTELKVHPDVSQDQGGTVSVSSSKVDNASADARQLDEKLKRLSQRLQLLEKQFENYRNEPELPNSGVESTSGASSFEENSLAGVEQSQLESDSLLKRLDMDSVATLTDLDFTSLVSDELTRIFQFGEWREGIYLDDITCSASLCRIVTQLASQEGTSELSEQLAKISYFQNASSFYHAEGQLDGSIALVTYLAREGYDLPAP